MGRSRRSRRSPAPADTPPEAGVVPAAPELLSSGTYATYRTPGGGLVISYRPVDATEDQMLSLPPKIIALAERFAAGDMPGPLGALFERMTS